MRDYRRCGTSSGGAPAPVRPHPAEGRARGVSVRQLTREDFEHLLEFRTSLRKFQRWSEDQANAAGLTHVQISYWSRSKGIQVISRRLLATSPGTCSSGITVRSSLWTGPRRPAWSGASATPATAALSGCGLRRLASGDSLR